MQLDFFNSREDREMWNSGFKVYDLVYEHCFDNCKSDDELFNMLLTLVCKESDVLDKIDNWQLQEFFNKRFTYNKPKRSFILYKGIEDNVTEEDFWESLDDYEEYVVAYKDLKYVPIKDYNYVCIEVECDSYLELEDDRVLMFKPTYCNMIDSNGIKLNPSLQRNKVWNLPRQSIHKLQQALCNHLESSITKEEFSDILSEYPDFIFVKFPQTLYRGIALKNRESLNRDSKFESFTTIKDLAIDFAEHASNEDKPLAVLLKVQNTFGFYVLNLVKILGVFNFPEITTEENEFFVSYEECEYTVISDYNELD